MHLLHSFHLLVLLDLILFFIPISPSQDSHYKACVPSQCKDINISYPFGVKSQPDYCSHPSFMLSCDEEGPILNLGPDSFTIQDIDYANHKLLIVNRNFISNSCPEPKNNLTLDSYPFDFPSEVRNLSFYYCNTPYIPGFSWLFSLINCLSNETHITIFTDHYGMVELWFLERCEAPIMVPVLKSSLHGLWTFEGALQKGFTLAWHEDEGCEQCESSGGRCGYNTSTKAFVCLCSTGDYPTTCKPKVWLKVVIGISAAAGTLLLTCAAFFVYYRRRKMKQTSPSSLFLTRSMSSDPPIKPDHEKGSTTQFLTNMPTLSLFTYQELEQATNSFNPSNELGDGGFGTVYYGKLRDGRSVAVKRLYENNYKRVEQFMNEVKILSGLRHQNLVCLYGCTSRHSRELLLVYEYIPNGTVADHLHGDLAKVKGGLNWSIRLKIALETAEALAFLHAVEPPIIHRDVKTNNILLDNSYQVKVADFGLSRLFPLDATHVSTAPQGTPGYVDPDYHQCYQLTDKSDVYSFGVVLVELISSKPAVDITRHRHEINLANLAINKIINRALSELVDQSLGFESDFRVRRMMTGVAELAFRCLSAEKEERPTMEEVLEILRGIEKDGIEGKIPKEQPDILADDVVLLKNQVPFSPDSVTEKWASRSTTPNTSNEG